MAGGHYIVGFHIFGQAQQKWKWHLSKPSTKKKNAVLHTRVYHTHALSLHTRSLPGPYLGPSAVKAYVILYAVRAVLAMLPTPAQP
jgi:hypothetical protein